MTRDPATTAFVRFCKTGEPQQLGAVFDLLAPELLLVAARLLPSGGDAPDLVQQTFVTAMQQRRKFDATRAVAPWLVGILLQHVRHERRRLRRQVDASRLCAPAVEDPAALAASREEAEAVRRAVVGIPQPYRQVLQLHLVHGLSVAAVAASLERPFRTVQSQLRRGLQQLQRALPAVVMVRWGGTASLALVRAQVLRAAASLWLGWLALPWLRLAAGLALLLLPCALVAATWASEEMVTPVVVAAQGASSAAAATAAESPEPRVGSDVAMQRVLLQDPQPMSRVRVRVLAAEDKTPLAGATLRASVHERLADGRSSPAREVESVPTDANGEAVMQVPRGRQFVVDLTVQDEGRQELWHQVFGTDRDEYRYDDVSLWRLVQGRVHVVDQHGAAVPFVDVFVNTGGGQTFMPRSASRSQTGSDGWTGEFAMPSGEVRVGMRRLPVDFALGDDTEVRLAVDGGDCEVVLQRPDPATVIAGRIVDEHGEPVDTGWVQLVRAGDRVPVTLGHVLCDGEGRFLVPVPPAQRGPFLICGGVGQGAGQTGNQTYERGADDALLQLRWPEGLALSVVDDKTGAPVEEYGVVCFRVHAQKYGWISGDRQLRLNGWHAGGRVFLDRLEAGDNRLLVVPTDETRLPSGYLPVRIAAEGATQLTVRLHRPANVAVHVAVGDGSPAVDSRVHLMAKLSEDENWKRLLPLPYGDSHFQGRLILATATTDERGVARLPWQPWRESVIVRAEGPGHLVGELELAGVAPGGEAIELRVARGAAVLGQANSMDRLPELAVDLMGKPLPDLVRSLRPAVVLRNAADGVLFEDPLGNGFPIGSDGKFVCRDVPPGRWQLLFQFTQFNDPTGGGTIELSQRPLAELITITGKDSTATIDLAQVVPGSLSGRVFVDGVPVRAQQLMYWVHRMDHLGRWQRGGSGVAAEQYAAADGSYRIGRVYPGEADIDATIDGREYHLFEPIAIAPGEHKQVDLHYRRLVARIRLVRADGSPVGGRLLRVAGEVCTADSNGWLVLDPAPALHFDVAMYPAGIDRSALWQYRYDDPRVRKATVGKIDLDPSQPRSEHQLVVREE